jgi:ferredoxin
MSMKVIVNQDKCISSGQCVLHAGHTFDQRDEDGVVVLLDENPPDEYAEDVRRAVANCPAQVITVEE